jgi:hypothetical protein
MVLLGYGIARPMKLMPLGIKVVIDHLRWTLFLIFDFDLLKLVCHQTS